MVKKSTKQKDFKEENLNKNNKKDGEMAEKRKIRGQCYEVRERNTSQGKKGTIIKKCSKRPRKRSFWDRF